MAEATRKIERLGFAAVPRAKHVYRHLRAGVNRVDNQALNLLGRTSVTCTAFSDRRRSQARTPRRGPPTTTFA